MSDSLLQQFVVEFQKAGTLSAKAADDLVSKVTMHENDQQLKFRRYLDGKSKIDRLDIGRMQLESQLQCHLDSEQEIVAAEQEASKSESREQARVTESENKTCNLRSSVLENEKEQDMRNIYQDMVNKLAEMHTASRQSQSFPLTNERSKLEEQVASITTKNNEIQLEVDRLSEELDATGYQGLIHDTRRALMVLVKNNYTAMKNELLQLRLANHTLRIRSRTAQANLALEK